MIKIRLILLSVCISGLLLLLQLTGCSDEEPKQILIPQLVTTSISGISQTGASSGGTIVSDGGGSISATGICWSTSTSPTISGDRTTDAVASGSFTSTISSLIPGTTYFIRAYASNIAGTGYGNEITFTTLAPVTDFDGNVYNVVRIGNQTWMAENLKSVHYADGTSINGVYAYSESETNADVYGRLYTWPAALRGTTGSNATPSGIQGVCPSGYHLPSLAEWEVLLNGLGGSEVAGGKLKQTGTVQNGTGLWQAPNTGATNTSGFTALPGGIRYSDGDYQVLGYTGFLWSATRETTFSYLLGLGNEINFANLLGWGTDLSASDAVSVRCLKN